MTKERGDSSAGRPVFRKSQLNMEGIKMKKNKKIILVCLIIFFLLLAVAGGVLVYIFIPPYSYEYPPLTFSKMFSISLHFVLFISRIAL